MKKTEFYVRVFLASLLASTQLAHADWQQTTILRLKGRDIRCFAVSGGNLFAGTADSGVFLSSNNGASWSAANTGLTDKTVRSLAASGGNVFAGTKMSGVFLSTDAGASWNPANTGTLKFGNVMSLAISGGNLFALADTGDIFRSTDNGANWTRANTGLIYSVVSVVAIGTNLFAATWKGGVFLNTDGGASWTQTNTDLVSPCYRSFAAKGTNLFAGSDSGIFLSTNNGANWTSANTGLPIIRHVTSLAVSGTYLFAGTGNSGVFVSPDGGASWTVSGLTNQTINFLAASGGNVFAGTGSGVFVSSNNGASWTSVNTGLSYRFDFNVLSLAVSGGNVFAGTSGTQDSGLFRSTDNGANWSASGFTSVGSFAVGGTNLFALAGNGVFRSIDNGTNWTSVNTGFPYGVISLAAIGTNLFAGTNHTGSDFVPCIFSSANNGESWASGNMTENNNPVSAPVTSFAASGEKFYAGTDGGGVFRSTDGGASWTSTRTGFTGTRDLSLAAIGDNIFEATNGGGVSLSTDGGANWISANTGLPHNASNNFARVNSMAISGPNLFAGTDSGVFLSTNNCQSWTAINTGLPAHTLVNSIALSETYLFAGTGGGAYRGVWLRPLSEMIPVFPAPAIVSVSPASGVNNAAVQITNLSGSNFRSSATVKFVKTGQADINATGVSIISPTQIACTIGISGAAAGQWDVVVINDDLKSAALSKGFTILSAPPTLVSPVNNAANLSVTPTLVWHKIANDSLYTIQVSTNSGFSSFLTNNNLAIDTFLTLPSSLLANNTPYYWRVAITKKGGEVTSFSTPWSFVTIPLAAPGWPPLVSPVDLAADVSINPIIVWNRVSGATVYRLQVAIDTLFNSINIHDSTLTDTSRSCTALLNDTKYFWRVNASNAGGAGMWSSVRRFTTIVAGPSVVALKSPGDTVKIDSVFLAWSIGTPKVDRYWVECASDSSFTTPALDSAVLDTVRLVRELQNNGRIWWRVKAHNAAGWGDWSVKKVFVIKLLSTYANLRALPNAFNFSIAERTGSIKYALPKAEHVYVRLYNISGKLQSEPVNKEQNGGYYALTLQRNLFASGSYLVIFKAGNFHQERLIFLMK